MAEVGDRVELVGKVLKIAMQSGRAGSGALGPRGVQGLDAFTERLNQGQPVAGQEAILGPAPVPARVLAMRFIQSRSLMALKVALSSSVATKP